MEHESGKLHVTGEAIYIDDILTSSELLHGFAFTSPHAHARVLSWNLEKAKKLDGVQAVLCATDIPGPNQMGAIIKDEPVLANELVEFVGQAMFLIAAKTEDTARRAAELIEVKFEELEPILDLPTAMKKGTTVQPSRKIERGDIEAGLKQSEFVLDGTLETGAQEHWYLETQASLAIPGESNEIKVFSSTQHPSETQALVAEVLGISKMETEVEVRRMGGAFGGKETQANHVAIWTALLAQATKRPVKIRLFRDDDQIMTGKRHPFLFSYKAGYDSEGKIIALEMIQNANAGYCTDLSMAVLERAMMHADNAYYIENIKIEGHAWKTNLASNTAFRGFGGPQGMTVIETVLDQVARKLGKDAADIRSINLYRTGNSELTPYGQIVENNQLQNIWEQLMTSSEYQKRRSLIQTFNVANEFTKKGIAITPVKFGISFTSSFLNQAGALVNIYKDGSVLVNHGGTEMGQGLHTKIQAIAAKELGIDPVQIKVSATNTSKVPNTSATAASAGTDLNGMAVKNAIDKLKERLSALAARLLSEGKDNASHAADIVFQKSFIFDKTNPERKYSFSELMPIANFHQVSLSETGFYKTPDIFFDREKGRGKPYHYFAFGAAVSEVTVDTLTGHVTTERVDILHDVGESINERIDIGQIEGGFVQGMGWCITEDCKWDSKGNLLNHSPDTYKIPNVQDIPKIFNVSLLQEAPNLGTIHKSKAVGEPPLMLALSCWMAIKDALSAIAIHELEPDFSLPATNEVIVLSAKNLREQVRQKSVNGSL